MRGRRGLPLTLPTGGLTANVGSAIVNVGIPALRADLRTDDAQTGLVVGARIPFYALLLPAGARLGGVRGYRSAHLLGVPAFTAPSPACGRAPNAPVLVLARAVREAGAALMVPQVFTGIQLDFTGATRARAPGTYAVTLSAGAAPGWVLGGLPAPPTCLPRRPGRVPVHRDVDGLRRRGGHHLTGAGVPVTLTVEPGPVHAPSRARGTCPATGGGSRRERLLRLPSPGWWAARGPDPRGGPCAGPRRRPARRPPALRGNGSARGGHRSPGGRRPSRPAALSVAAPTIRS